MSPDLTAVGAAYGRAAHLALDDPPFVLEDALSIRLADAGVLQSAGLPSEEGLVFDRHDVRARWRGTFVGRARLVEDVVEHRLAAGTTQFVILGAGLDTFALRRADLMARLHVYEVDDQRTQAWKVGRVRDLGLETPGNLRFVGVNFESGDSWLQCIEQAGFDATRPAVIASTGVSQYISRAATEDTLRAAASLPTTTTFVCTSARPLELVDDPVLRELRTLTEERVAARGTPFISFYSLDEFAGLCRAAGFESVRYVTDQVNERYFAGRGDGLRLEEDMWVAVRR